MVVVQNNTDSTGIEDNDRPDPSNNFIDLEKSPVRKLRKTL